MIAGPTVTPPPPPQPGPAQSPGSSSSGFPRLCFGEGATGKVWIWMAEGNWGHGNWSHLWDLLIKSSYLVHHHRNSAVSSRIPEGSTDTLGPLGTSSASRGHEFMTHEPTHHPPTEDPLLATVTLHSYTSSSPWVCCACLGPWAQ